jgi:hypothetical protein
VRLDQVAETNKAITGRLHAGWIELPDRHCSAHLGGTYRHTWLVIAASVERAMAADDLLIEAKSLLKPWTMAALVARPLQKFLKNGAAIHALRQKPGRP